MMTHHPLEGAGALLRDLAYASRSPQVSGRVAGLPVVTLPDGTTVLSGFGMHRRYALAPPPDPGRPTLPRRAAHRLLLLHLHHR